MWISRLQKFFITPLSKSNRSVLIFWFSLSLTFSIIYGILALQQAFSSEYVVQDDARQHVFWMQRFIDRELFPNDYIADYFQSVAPWGYTTLYQIFAKIGINPMVFNKIVPIFLGVITTVYCFGCTLQLFPVPAAGFLCSLLLTQSIWMKDDLISGTPRAFVYPLFVAFLYYFLRRSTLGTGIAIGILGLFYPHYVLVAAGTLILSLITLKNKRLQLSKNRQDYQLVGVGLVVAFVVLLPYVLEPSQFGPVISAAEAKLLPEFQPGGRSAFFHDDFLNFLFDGRGSGILPSRLPISTWTAIFLPALIHFPLRFPLVQEIQPKISLLPRILLSSLTLFIAAHAVLFKLHLPSRYTQHSLRIVMALAAGITLIILLDTVLKNFKTQPKSDKEKSVAKLSLGFAFLLALIILTYPSYLKKFPKSEYAIGRATALYEFFQQQPKDTLIASLAEEASNLPSFSQRSILVAREYAIPYHKGYYSNLFRPRTIEVIEAQYSSTLEPAQQLIAKYGIDFWLLDHLAFTPEYLTKNRWRRQFHSAIQAGQRLENGETPALEKLINQCAVFQQEGFIILKAACITQAPNN